MLQSPTLHFRLEKTEIAWDEQTIYSRYIFEASCRAVRDIVPYDLHEFNSRADRLMHGPVGAKKKLSSEFWR